MQQRVRGHRVAPEGSGFAVQGGEASACLGDHGHECRHVVELELGLGGQVDGALGHEHVGPEVPVGAGAPARLHEPQHPAQPLGLRPPRQRGVGHRGPGEVVDAGHRQPPRRAQGAPGPGPAAGHGPPAPPQRGGRDQPDDALAVLDEADERGPHRHAPHEVLGPVDRVDDPLARGVPGGGQLLTQDGVAPARPPQLLADDALGLLVGLGDRREVRLGLHGEVAGVEAGQGEAVHLVGDRVRQVQVIAPAPLLGRGSRQRGLRRCR